MQPRLSIENAVIALATYGAWFGPPPAEFKGTLIDGRIRVRACASFGVRPPKSVVLDSVESALRWLVVAGHVQRAHELAVASGIEVDDLFAVRIGLPDYVVASVHAEVHAKQRHKRRRAVHVECRDRRRAQERLLELARSAVESNRAIDPEEIYAAFR